MVHSFISVCTCTSSAPFPHRQVESLSLLARDELRNHVSHPEKHCEKKKIGPSYTGGEARDIAHALNKWTSVAERYELVRTSGSDALRDHGRTFQVLVVPGERTEVASSLPRPSTPLGAMFQTASRNSEQTNAHFSFSLCVRLLCVLQYDSYSLEPARNE